MKKKFKVGEYVVCEDAIGRVTAGSTPEDGYCWIEVDGVSQIARDVKKVNIKFKAFGLKTTIRQIKSLHKTYEFSMTFDLGIEVAQIWEMSIGVTIKQIKIKNFVDREKARDWLELQYATMLAKARGLL